MSDFYSNVDIKKFGDHEAENAAGHNLRQIPSANVNPKKSHLNEFLVGAANMSFNSTLTSKLSKFKVRKNAVKSVNLVFSASPEFLKDKTKAKQWKELTFKFICDEFGIDNIVYAVVHNDETSKHIQVSVIPVDPKGKLNASHFFDGRKKCAEFTTRYNKAVRHLGLKRDKGNLKAKPSDTRDFYNKVAQANNFDKKVDQSVASLEKDIASKSAFGYVKTSTVLSLLSPLYGILKSYQAKILADKEKVAKTEKLAKELEDLKLKFENMGLSHKMKFLECEQVKNQIAEGKIAIATKEALASNVWGFDFENISSNLPKKKKNPTEIK